MGKKIFMQLKADLEKYVCQGMTIKEILDFMLRDFSSYQWSIRTLDRRLRYFEIYYNDSTVTVEDVRQPVKKEIEGSGELLGYCEMHRKLDRGTTFLYPAWDAVYDVMADVDPEGLKARGPGPLALRKSEVFGHAHFFKI